MDTEIEQSHEQLRMERPMKVKPFFKREQKHRLSFLIRKSLHLDLMPYFAGEVEQLEGCLECLASLFGKMSQTVVELINLRLANWHCFTAIRMHKKRKRGDTYWEIPKRDTNREFWSKLPDSLACTLQCSSACELYIKFVTTYSSPFKCSQSL